MMSCFKEGEEYRIIFFNISKNEGRYHRLVVIIICLHQYTYLGLYVYIQLQTIALVTKVKSKCSYSKINSLLSIDHQVTLITGDIVFESIKSFDLIIHPNASDENLSSHELEALEKYIASGKSWFCLAQEHTHKLQLVNTLLSKFGMKFEHDGIVRTAFSKYLHPKNALVNDGILHPSLLAKSNSEITRSDVVVYKATSEDESIPFVYPHGCSIDVIAPSQPILSSGMFSFPCKRPIASAWEDLSSMKRNERARVISVGSSLMFADEWIDKEGNKDLFISFTKYLLHDGVSFDLSLNRKEGRIEESKVVPDIESLSERLRWCLDTKPPLPQDVSSLLRKGSLTYDMSMVPKIVQLYRDLNVEKEPLDLITPEFELPTPPLQPAVFPPKALPFDSPPLEFFDLDEELSDPLVRLGQLAAESNDNDLERFIRGAGECVGIHANHDKDDGKDILYFVFQTVSIDETIYVYIHMQMNSLSRSSDWTFFSFIRYFDSGRKKKKEMYVV